MAATVAQPQRPPLAFTAQCTIFIFLAAVIAAASCIPRGMTEAHFPRQVRSAYSPSWSPDGGSIAAVGHGASPRQDLLVFNVATGETTFVLTLEDRFLSAGVEWSPVDDRLAASAGTFEGPDGIWLVGDGEPEPRFIASGHDASWSPDGTRLAVIDNFNDGPSLKIVDARSGDVMNSFSFDRVEVAAETLSEVKWARAHNRVAIVASNVPAIGSNTYGVYVVDLDSGTISPALVDSGISVGRGLAWSPDDRWILLTLMSSGDEIAALPTDGGCLVRLLPALKPAWDLDLSSDGNCLAVKSSRGLILVDITESMGASLGELLVCPPV